MSVRLMVRQRAEAGGAEKAQEVVLDEPVILIGRDKACQVVLAQQAVSRQHARITQDGSLFFVEDLGSAYGTQVNQKALPKGEKRLLRNGDIVAVAQFDITFDRLADVPKDGDGPPRHDKTSFIAKAVVKDVMRGIGSAGEGPYFRIMNGPKEGQKIPIEEAQELVVGREEGADIIFKGDDLISRKHAKFRRDWSGVHVEDLQSRNGIKVNKKRTTRKTLKDRDEVEIGGIRLLFLDPSEVREAPVVLPEEEGESTESSKQQARAEAAAKEEEAPEEAAPAEEEAPPDSQPSEESPAEEDAPREEAAASEDEAPAEESPSEEPSPDLEEQEPKQLKDKGGNAVSRALQNPQQLAVIAVLGVVAILAIVLLIALIAGA
ncbi:MAG: FHA domain-containing protein [Myxococcaceae bacterium]